MKAFVPRSGKDSKDYLFLGIALSTYAILLAVLKIYIEPVYGYRGFEWEPNPYKFIVVIGMIAVLSRTLSLKITSPCDWLLHVHMLVPVIPMLTLYAGSDTSTAYMLTVVASVVVMNMLARKELFLAPKLPTFSANYVLAICFLLVSMALLWLYVRGAFSLFEVGFYDVYEKRGQVKAMMPSSFGYLFHNLTKALIPAALLLLIVKQRFMMALLLYFFSLILFFVTGHKALVFYPFAVVGIYYLIRFSRKNAIYLWLLYIAMIIISTLGFYFVYDLIGSLLVRRISFVPALLNNHYYEFFQSNPFVYWSNSSISMGLLDYPYDKNIPYVIGEYYYNNPKTSAGAGFMGYAYAHLGYAGIIIYALIVSMTFSVVASVIKNKTQKERDISIAIIMIPAVTLFTSSDLFITLLTHGLFSALVIAAFSCLDNTAKPFTILARPE